MTPHRLSIGLSLEESPSGNNQDLIPVFHSWIQKQSIPDHLLVDVHDYSHVPNGPGILLYGHEGSFSLDIGQNRAGLIYQRTQGSDGSFQNQLSETLRPLLQGCCLLESQQRPSTSLGFKTNGFRVTLHDRLNAPNTDETYRRFEPLLSDFLELTLESDGFTLVHLSDPRELFAIEVHLSSSPLASELLARLENDTTN
jgi:hypothetical protein